MENDHEDYAVMGHHSTDDSPSKTLYIIVSEETVRERIDHPSRQVPRSFPSVLSTGSTSGILYLYQISCQIEIVYDTYNILNTTCFQTSTYKYACTNRLTKIN